MHGTAEQGLVILGVNSCNRDHDSSRQANLSKEAVLIRLLGGAKEWQQNPK